MPVFMDDPSVLTKERLKRELLANNVELPGGNPSRDVYVQLYVKTLSAQSHSTDAAPDAFSSDEELPPPPVESRKSRSSGRKSASARPEQLDVTLLTDEALRELLLACGVQAGPIVASTRKLYENKLQNLQGKAAASPEPPKNHNGSGDAEAYSDQEDELTTAPDPKTEPAPEPADKLKEAARGHRNNTSQRRISQHSTVTILEVLGPLSTEKESEVKSYSPVRRPRTPSSRHASVPGSSSKRSPAPAATDSPRPAQAPLDSLTFISNWDISPIRRPSESKQGRVSSAATEKVLEVEQLERIETELLPEEDPAVPEFSLSGLTATCRRPIKGAAGHLVTPANHSQSEPADVKSSSSAFSAVSSAPTPSTKPALLTHSAPSSATPFVRDASAPSASGAGARRGMLWWKQLLVGLVLAAFLFLVYQAMETNRASPFEETQEL